MADSHGTVILLVHDGDPLRDSVSYIVHDDSQEAMITETSGETQSIIVSQIYWPALEYEDNIDDCE